MKEAAFTQMGATAQHKARLLQIAITLIDRVLSVIA